MVTRSRKKNLKMTLGLLRLQKQVHQRPKLLSMHLHITTKTLEVQECSKELGLFLKASLEKKQLQDGTKVPGVKMDLMVIVILVLTLVIRLWIVGSMEEEGLEAPMSQLNVGHAIKSDMLLPHVTH